MHVLNTLYCTKKYLKTHQVIYYSYNLQMKTILLVKVSTINYYPGNYHSKFLLLYSKLLPIFITRYNTAFNSTLPRQRFHLKDCNLPWRDGQHIVRTAKIRTKGHVPNRGRDCAYALRSTPGSTTISSCNMSLNHKEEQFFSLPSRFLTCCTLHSRCIFCRFTYLNDIIDQ